MAWVDIRISSTETEGTDDFLFLSSLFLLLLSFHHLCCCENRTLRRLKQKEKSLILVFALICHFHDDTTDVKAFLLVLLKTVHQKAVLT